MILENEILFASKQACCPGVSFTLVSLFHLWTADLFWLTIGQQYFFTDLIVMFSKINGITNYYEILGVDKNASFEEIKSAYRKQALDCHPDKNINTDTTKMMQQLNRAYEVLSDELSRREYDNTLNSNHFEFQDSSEEVDTKNATSFFNQNKQSQPHQDKFTFEQWTVESQGFQLFIFHPSFRGGKSNITIFPNSTLSLPINWNIYLQRRVRNFLLSCSDSYSCWSDGEVEFVFDLPSNKQLMQKILDGVFNIYKMPKEVANFIYQKLDIPKINHPENNKSFEDLFETTVSNYKKNQLGEWELSHTAAHLFIAHPSLKGCKENITFFNIYTDPIIVLPINHNRTIKEHLVKKVVDLLNDPANSVNDVEMVIKLPQDKKSLEKMLDVVFYLYNFPEELITYIQKLAILFEDSHCNGYSCLSR